jgi:hypothetical protein
LDDFPEGTFFAPLATLTEAELFLPAVAETLGVKETGAEPLVETLKDYLSERRMWRDLPAWLEQKEKRSVRRGCGVRRRPYTNQRAFQETSTSSPGPTLAFSPCAWAWERKHGRRRGARDG